MGGLGLPACVPGVHVSSRTGIMWLALRGVRPARVHFLLCGPHKSMNAPGMYLIGKRICSLFSWLLYSDVVWG